MIWPFNRKNTTETGAEHYIRDAAIADARAVVEFKHRLWRDIYADFKDAAFFETAEATIAEQVKFWQSRIRGGETIWLAEDLRGAIVGTIHATESLSDQTAEFAELYGLEQLCEIRFFYLSDAAEDTNVAATLIQHAVGDRPALAWLSGDMPLVDTVLREAGLEPLGKAVHPTTEPWQGVPRQAMVRR
ncbi:hypothetical protein [Yaniella halotolerans]|uniref:hypothetical protein n=1 Tax=Yaniella halotolerans TaxID=225453 RepID=UPI0003B7263D|nr:hypothetical protein [Yaniella halotolerans]